VSITTIGVLGSLSAPTSSGQGHTGTPHTVDTMTGDTVSTGIPVTPYARHQMVATEPTISASESTNNQHAIHCNNAIHVEHPVGTFLRVSSSVALAVRERAADKTSGVVTHHDAICGNGEQLCDDARSSCGGVSSRWTRWTRPRRRRRAMWRQRMHG
jgi:hypothetical protein